MNHSKSTRVRGFCIKSAKRIVGAVLYLTFLTLLIGTAKAQYSVYPHGGCTDYASPYYTLTLTDDGADSVPSGDYLVYLFLNGTIYGSLHITINTDRSFSLSGGGSWIGAADPWAAGSSFTLTTDGNLYDGSGSTVVGSVSAKLATFTFTPDFCNPFYTCPWYPGDCPIYYPIVPLNISVNKCKGQTRVAGNVASKLDSLDVHIGLGGGTNSQLQISGELEIQADSPITNLATPKALNPPSGFAFKTINDANGLRQVLSGQVLADIIVSNAFQYDIRLYQAVNAGSTNTNGLYQPIGLPFKIVDVQNPDASTAMSNRLWVTEFEGNVTNQYQYTYDTNSTGNSNTWTLLYPQNLRKDVLTTVWNTNRTEKTTLLSVYNPGSPDVLVYQEQDKYENYTGTVVQVEQVLDPDGARLTNSWQYYTNSAQPNTFTKLAQKVQWNGYWEQYQYDSNGRETNLISGYLNTTNGSSANLCRVTSTSYSSTAPNITRIETVMGQEVGRTYTAYFPSSNCVKTIQCQYPGASWTDSSNLISTVNEDSYLRPSTVWNKDGTMTFYTYVTNSDYSVTTSVTTGQPNTSGTAIAEGTQTITVVGPFGQMISNIVINVTGSTNGAVTAQDSYSYATDDYNFSSPTVMHLDGTQTSGSSGCCGTPNLGNSVDNDGTITYYTFDALLRTISTTLNGVAMYDNYDAVGNLLSTVRYDTNGSPTTLSQAAFDDAGLQVSATDALNNTTTYTNYFNGNGQLVKQTTYADSSTRIETYYLDGSLQSVTGTAVFPMRYTNGVELDGGVYRTYSKTIELDTSDNDTANWTKTYTDSLGRTYKSVFADNSYSQSVYNNQGQLTEQIDPDGVTTLYQYDGRGILLYTAVDMNTNGAIDFSGTDRVTETVNDVIADNGVNVNRTRTYVWTTNSANTSNLVSTVETSVDGLQTWNITFNNSVGVTNHTQTTYIPTNGYRIVTVTAPDGSTTSTTNQYGRVISVTQLDANAVQIGRTSYGYDAQGRQNATTDARDGTTTLIFNNADQISSTVSPSPDGIQSPPATTNYFDSRDRIWKTTLPDNTSVTNVYYPTGLLEETYGSRTYPVEYTYDAQGRVKTMMTWQNFAANSGTATTTWNFDSYRGFLTNKVYADGHGPSYTYTAAGRLLTRTWARGVTTTYGYDAAGDLNSVSYSDSTPGMTNTFDRQGRESTVVCNGMTATLTYNLANELLSESYSGGPLNGLTVTNVYDSLLRRATNGLWNGSSWQAQTLYAYDAASRLSTVSDGTNSAAYTYVANSPLVSQVVFTNNGTLRMTTTNRYDHLNRLTSIVSTPSASYLLPLAFNYNYNPANQRTATTNADNSHWVYQYDSLGQVTNGCRYFADGTPVAGQQFDYVFDTIGNRTQTQAGGDATGANLRVANYTNNTLNQITSRDIPGFVDIMGASILTNAVTVNGQTAYRKEEYFRQQLTASNSLSALWTNIIVSGGQAVTGNVYVAQQPERFGYDADGNLTNDGRWAYIWDGENRLVRMTVNTNVGPEYQLIFGYDYRGRRIQKIVSTNNGSVYVPQFTNDFLYDGWNLIAEVTPNDSLIRTYVWGSDLSGSLQGAGSVGGLLETSYCGAATTNCFMAYDGNDNVAALVNPADGTILANYEYGPFGEVIRSTGPMAKANPFRFSTKYQDDESDLVYYGIRYYNPSTGRWLSKDPMEEKVGMNLYGFIANDPIDLVDYLGLLDNGTIKIETSNPDGSDRWNVMFKWTPPGDICCRCKKVVWVQNKNDTAETFLFTIHSQGVDWDESNYMGSSDPWECGGNKKDSVMWDTPGPTFWSQISWTLWRSFKATSQVKCIEGPEKGSIYGTVNWWFYWQRNPYKLVGGATQSIGAIAGY